ncbi:MAG: hypothetical protein K6E53_08455 [Lachnospiraceae bacterium]|nr:hypothetical protein [Lachnospiraceae bacterium]
MKKRTMIRTIACMICLSLLAGCGNSKNNDPQTAISDNSGKDTQSADAEADDAALNGSEKNGSLGAEENNDSETENNDGQTKEVKRRRAKGLKEASEGETPDPIPFSFMNHPCEFWDGDTVLAIGNYYTFELKPEIKESYPELDMILDQYNHSANEDLMIFFDSNEDDILGLRNDGWNMYYENDTFLRLLRSDGKVFSFVEECYGFYGGAHGTTSYTGHNYDPVSGDEIKFDSVVADKSKLPDIVVDELIAQNEDLEEYFANDPGGKRDLLLGLPERFNNNASGITWGLSYEGLELYFEDYAMGSYAAGSRTVTIRFEDYPDVFTGKYTQYAGAKDKPDMDEIAGDLGAEDTKKIMVSSYSPDEHSDNGTPVTMTKDMQKKLNLFISNFAEQGFGPYDYGHYDVEDVANFAYMWAKINKQDYIEIDQKYEKYKISFANIQKIVDRYFGLKLREDELISHSWTDDYRGYYKDGYLFMPLADGETYTGFAVVDSASDFGNGTMRLEFTVYEVDLDLYFDQGIPNRFYTFNTDDAKRSLDITEERKGYAIVRQNGDSYKLQFYEIY